MCNSVDLSIQISLSWPKPLCSSNTAVHTSTHTHIVFLTSVKYGCSWKYNKFYNSCCQRGAFVKLQTFCCFSFFSRWLKPRSCLLHTSVWAHHNNNNEQDNHIISVIPALDHHQNLINWSAIHPSIICYPCLSSGGSQEAGVYPSWH